MIRLSPSDSQTVYITARQVRSFGLPSWTPEIGTSLMKSDDGGFSWETFDLKRSMRPKVAGLDVLDIPYFAVSSKSSKLVCAFVRFGQHEAALLLTADGGATWRDIFPDQLLPNPLLEKSWGTTAPRIAIDPNGGKTIYLAYGDALLKTSDGGSRWVQLRIKESRINDIAVSDVSSQVVYVAGDTGLWESRDAGLSWRRMDLAPLQEKVRKVFTAGDAVFAQGYNGIYRRINGNQQWVMPQWKEWEEKPESNPIAFVPVSASQPDSRETQPEPGKGGSAAQPPASGVSSATCGSYDLCLRAGINAFESANWERAIVDFQGAASNRPDSPEPWVWLGKTDVAANHSGDAPAMWDKALRLGGQISLDACHEHGLLACENGSFVMSTKEISFTTARKKLLFSTPPSGVASVEMYMQLSGQDSDVRLRIAGKAYTIDFFPFGVTCDVGMYLQCPLDGAVQETSLTKYVAGALQALAAGKMPAP